MRSESKMLSLQSSQRKGVSLGHVGTNYKGPKGSAENPQKLAAVLWNRIETEWSKRTSDLLRFLAEHQEKRHFRFLKLARPEQSHRRKKSYFWVLTRARPEQSQRRKKENYQLATFAGDRCQLLICYTTLLFARVIFLAITLIKSVISNQTQSIVRGLIS